MFQKHNSMPWLPLLTGYLLCVSATNPNLTVISVSLSGCIGDTAGILSRNRILGEEVMSLKEYSITDTMVLDNTSIHLIDFEIQIRICSHQFIKISSLNFDLLSNCNTQHTSIMHIKSTPSLSGKKIMLIIHHVLSRLDMTLVTLINTAYIPYSCRGIEYDAHLIVLRCIRGKPSDWYSEFGYFNENRVEIEAKIAMIQRKHTNALIDGAEQNVSLCRFLQTLWNLADKNQFHREFSKFTTIFEPLLELRKGQWRKVLTPN